MVAAFSLRVIISRPPHYTQAAAVAQGLGPATPESMRHDFAQLLGMIYRSVVPGGTLLIAEHDGALTLYQHLRAMEEAGFDEVDCSYRNREYFIVGCRRPL